jgi:hypothetical protein
MPLDACGQEPAEFGIVVEKLDKERHEWTGVLMSVEQAVSHHSAE